MKILFWLGLLTFMPSLWQIPSAAAASRWHVVEAGAAGDGEADCTAIFQRLLDDAGKARGGVVEVPAGRFRINGQLIDPSQRDAARHLPWPAQPSQQCHRTLERLNAPGLCRTRRNQ